MIFVSGLGTGLMAACSSEAEDPSTTASEIPTAKVAVPAEEVADDGRVALAADVEAGQPTTLCNAEETPIFSCKVRRGKIASVCLAKGAGGEFAQYRFGSAGAAPEMVGPSASSEQMEWASVPYSGGGEAQLSFAAGDVRYVVYSKVVRTNFTAGEPNNPAMSDGVAVLRSGKIAANFACEADLQPIDVTAAQAHLAKADDLFTYDIE
ncbi:MAG: hypothetical protein B7Y88_03060 [Sphingomonadales bacterium 32-64-17]|nr:MAG: hypothetical protein B7Y88_03060 [Sphingomonadales bacterium 32-64-17]